MVGHSTQFCRRLADAEDRLDAVSSAAAANDAARLRQTQTLQALEVDAAGARARTRELEVLSQQQASLLQARAQAEMQLEETVRQLQQVLASEVFSTFLAFTFFFRACATAKPARPPPVVPLLKVQQACSWRLIIGKSWRSP